MQQAIVDRTQIEHLGFLFKQIDKRQEKVSLKAVDIQVLWRPIRCEDDYKPILAKRLKKSFENHGIRNIKDLELI